jgi:hypothetical protein
MKIWNLRTLLLFSYFFVMCKENRDIIVYLLSINVKIYMF